MGSFNISIYSVIMFICFIPAIVVHEVSHGFVANRLGDPTAKSQGRITLNPLKHIDPFGTVILPLFLMVIGGPVFGYAKPVPYNPNYFKNIRQGEFLTGIAGPASNLIMAAIGFIVSRVIPLVTQTTPAFMGTAPYAGYQARFGLIEPVTAGDWIVLCCYFFVLINLYLAFFNIIPIPPLDGASIIALFLTPNGLRSYYRIQRYALPVLMILLLVLPYVLGFSPLGIYLDATAGNITSFFFNF